MIILNFQGFSTKVTCAFQLQENMQELLELNNCKFIFYHLYTIDQMKGKVVNRAGNYSNYDIAPKKID